jgi:hypothetical protein
MVAYAFDLGLWTLIFFIVGMFKPQWPLFFLKKPDRFIIVVLTTIFVMMTFTLYGEGTKREKEAAEKAKAAVSKAATVNATPAPVPVPVPTPEKPATEKKPL